jgi:hypothetical protein
MAMNYDEIVKSARTETVDSVVFDMRKFPNEQAEALETWAQNTAMGVQMNVLKHAKPIILLCDSKAVLSGRATQLLSSLQSSGVNVEIQRAD